MIFANLFLSFCLFQCDEFESRHRLFYFPDCFKAIDQREPWVIGARSTPRIPLNKKTFNGNGAKVYIGYVYGLCSTLDKVEDIFVSYSIDCSMEGSACWGIWVDEKDVDRARLALERGSVELIQDGPKAGSGVVIQPK